MREFDVGEDGVLRWSPPVPPNGVILYYNVIITKVIEKFNDTNLELSPYGTYTVEVINMHVFLTARHNFLPPFEYHQVQAVTSAGAGKWSSPVNVTLTDNSVSSATDSDGSSSTDDGCSSSHQSTIAGLIVCIVVLLLLLLLFGTVFIVYVLHNR